MSYYVWVGPREVDAQFDNFISAKICYQSEDNPEKYRKANIYCKEYFEYIEQNIEKIIRKHADAKFILYNPIHAYKINKKFRDYIICLNDLHVLNILSNKIYTRFWLGNFVPTLPTILVDYTNFTFEWLENKLHISEKYVFQKNRGSGGFGTFILSRENKEPIVLKENTTSLFLVSPYIDNNISVNVNAIISDDDTLIFNPSLQLTEITDHRIIYHGSDYIAFQEIDSSIKEKINTYADIILQQVQAMGYRGIVGIDFLVANNEVYFLEINPRFQASSFLISISLQDYKLPTLIELNIAAFNSTAKICTESSKVDVRYSYYKYFYKKDYYHLYYIADKAKSNPLVKDIAWDGWTSDKLCDSDAYCYSLIFTTNIASINMDGSFNLYSNITGEEEYIKKYGCDPIGLKIALINQGCVVSDTVKNFLKTKGIIKQAVFNAIDFYIKNNLPINAPIDLRFSDFSPFNIEMGDENKIELRYYNHFISEVNIEMQPEWGNLTTKNGTSYKRIAYLSTDRLRIKHEGVCHYKSIEKSCKFCNVSPQTGQIDIDDINEVIDELMINPKFRHILIGGASGEQQLEYKRIAHVTKHIRKTNPNMPIYLMSTPPVTLKILEEYKKMGINEVAFNIEIWDRNFAKKIMPGKGYIPLSTYINSLNKAVSLWGRQGNVRSALIVGLNDTSNLIEGIETLCKNGIQPMLSIFRPMPQTDLEPLVPPSNTYLLNIYMTAQEICTRYNMQLGPSCDACKNNMLAI